MVDVDESTGPTKQGNLVKRGGGPRKAWTERLVVIVDGHISYFNKGQDIKKVALVHLVVSAFPFKYGMPPHNEGNRIVLASN